MVNFNKYFDKVYVINLDKRPDRYESFVTEMNKFGISNVERFSAVDGSVFPVENRRILPGEVGVLQSHLEIIKKSIDNGYNNILIIEDDVMFTDELNLLEEYMSSVPLGWDMIYFGGNHIYGPAPKILNDKVMKLNYTVALQCVAINKSMFSIIKSIINEMVKPIDVYYAELHSNCNAYGFYPNMAKQKPGYSNIRNEMVDYSNIF